MSTLSQFVGGGTPKSIQRVTVLNENTAKVYNIAAVDPAKSLVLCEGAASNSILAHAYLASATQIATMAGAGNGLSSVVQVIDFGGMVKSVQRGSIASSSGTIAIAAVNPAKCLVVINGAAAFGAANNMSFTLNASSLVLSSSYSAGTTFWQIVEFK